MLWASWLVTWFCVARWFLGRAKKTISHPDIYESLDVEMDGSHRAYHILAKPMHFCTSGLALLAVQERHILCCHPV
jgi:hypothetical protein